MFITDLPPCDSYDVGIYRTVEEVFGSETLVGEPLADSRGVFTSVEGFRVLFYINVDDLEIAIPFYHQIYPQPSAWPEGSSTDSMDIFPHAELELLQDVSTLYRYMSEDMREWYRRAYLEQKYYPTNNMDQPTVPTPDEPWGQQQSGSSTGDEGQTSSTPGEESRPKFTNARLQEFWVSCTPEVQAKLDPVLTSQVSILGIGDFLGDRILLEIAGVSVPIPITVYSTGEIEMAENDWVNYPQLAHLKKQ